jgi:hypothetical protein
MNTWRRAASGNAFSKIAFGLAAVLLLFAPPTARAQAIPDFEFCGGYFALCAASTCTPTGKQIAVNKPDGTTANFPEADCLCPVILGTSIANLSGGNMKGSCEPPPSPPGPGGQIWSTFQIRPDIPQALTDWVPTLPEAAAPPQICPASLNQGNQYAQCFSFLCDTETYINNVPVVTCHCALGADLLGNPVPPATAFPTQAGQRDQTICFEHPVSNVLMIPSP